MRKVLLVVTVFLIISFISCGVEDAQKADVIKSHYTITNEETLTDIKTMIDIRLESEVDKEILHKIANELREDGRRKYKRVFICYYLPGMKVDAGAWATSHFNPDLEVKISAVYK